MKSFRIALFFACFLLVACGGKSKPSSSPTRPQVETLPASVVHAYPAPGSQVPAGDFQAGFDGYDSAQPVESAGYRTNVCLSFDLAALASPRPDGSPPILPETVQPGSEYAFLAQKTTLILDQRPLAPQTGPSQAGPSRAVPGSSRHSPQWLCWPAALAAGTHQAVLKFYPTLERQFEYAWQFTLLESTPTPLVVVMYITATPVPSRTPSPTRTPYPTLKPGPTFTWSPPTQTSAPTPTRTIAPTLQPTFESQLTPATPASGPQGYRLKPWSEQDALAAITEARWIEEYYTYPNWDLWPYAPYDPFDYTRYIVLLEREALLRPLSSPARGWVTWDLLYRSPNDYFYRPLPGENFTTHLQEAFNTGQVTPNNLEEWLDSRGFYLDVVLPAENLAGDGRPALVFRVHNSFSAGSDAVFALLGAAPGEYQLELVHPWQGYFQGILDIQLGDHNGNGRPEIVLMDHFWGLGFSTYEIYEIYLYEWQNSTQKFVNITRNIPTLHLDRMEGAGFEYTSDYPWQFGVPDGRGVQTIQVPLIYQFWEKCIYLTDTITMKWDGSQYHWAGETFSSYDPAQPVTCQVAWALLQGERDDQALAVLETALADKPAELAETWGPAFVDYLRLQLGILYALHGQRQAALDALQALRDRPVHPEFSMASRLAGVFLDAYSGEQSLTACRRTVEFINDALEKQIPRGEIFAQYVDDKILARWGFDDPRWVYDGSAICDVQAAFEQSLSSQDPQDLEQFVLWLNRAGITHEIVQTADLTGDGTQEWIAVVQLASGLTWPVEVIVRYGDRLAAVVVPGLHLWPEDPGQITFAALRPDLALAPVAVLTLGEDLIVFRLIQGEQLGSEVLLTDYGFSHVTVDPQRQEITLYYPGGASLGKDTYTWAPELQNFKLTRSLPAEPLTQAEAIGQVEVMLFSDKNPAKAIPLLQAMLAGYLQETELWNEDRSKKLIVPHDRSYLMYLLGLSYELTGNDARAIRLYWQVWQDYPNNPYALIARHKLVPVSP